MKPINRQPIALLSIAADPAIQRHSVDTDKAIYSIYSLAEALTKLGWHVDVFTRRTQPDQPKFVQHSPYCRTIYLEAGPIQPIASQHLLEYLPQLVKAFQTFQTQEGMNYPLIHTCDWISGRIGLCLKELGNIQLVHSHSEQLQDDTVCCLTLSTIPEAQEETPHQQRLQLIDVQLMTEWELWQRANQVIVTRPSDDGMYHRFYGDAKARLGFNSTERIVLYVGSAHAHSGLDTLIQAFALCRDRCKDASRYTLRLVLVGDNDPQERQLIEQQLNAFQLSEQVQIVDAVPSDLLSLYYETADVCVIPSLYQPFGSVALEALTHGTPVVASNVGGLKFVVASEETGLLVPPQDAAALAEAIDRVLSNELWVRRLKRQASDQVDSSLSSIKVAAQLSDLYRRLIASSISQAGLLDMQKPYILQVPTTTLPNRSVGSIKPTKEKELMYVS